MRLPPSFYARPAQEVAPDLLGAVLCHCTDQGVLSGRIVEVEAYLGEADPGSHAFRGPTERNKVMFGPPGHAYIYLSYGMHVCMNVVTNADGEAGAVLIRALEPLQGIEAMERRRGGRPLIELCNGPGKLCQALGITLQEYGLSLQSDVLWIESGTRPAPVDVAVSTRVGIAAGQELPLRFFVRGSRFVSRGRPS